MIRFLVLCAVPLWDIHFADQHLACPDGSPSAQPSVPSDPLRIALRALQCNVRIAEAVCSRAFIGSGLEGSWIRYLFDQIFGSPPTVTAASGTEQHAVRTSSPSTSMMQVRSKKRKRVEALILSYRCPGRSSVRRQSGWCARWPTGCG